MTLVIFLFVTLLAAVLQATIPPFALSGYAPLPFLCGVVVYYALLHRTSRMVQAAILLGVLADSLGMMPLGFSSFCYAAIGLVIARFRDVMTVHAWTTHAFLGALANFVSTVAMWLLILGDGALQWPWHWTLFKFLGALVNGAVIVPLVFETLRRLDHLTGRIHREEAHPL